MVLRLKQLIVLHVQASDGAIGKMRDVHFDDDDWTIRYLVVETNVARQANVHHRTETLSEGHYSASCPSPAGREIRHGQSTAS